jgi:hypothetical protein
MNAPAAGWNPDPTGRHEYRYWDGGSWTDDVSDNGLTSVDPVAGGASPGGDPTAVVDTTQRYDTPSGPQSGGYPAQPGPQGPQSGGFPPQAGPQGPQSGGYPAQPGQAGPYGPSYGSGQLPPAQPARSGPPTGLIVGLAAVAIALIVGLVVVLGGDDGGDDDTATGTTETTADDTSDTTADDTSDTTESSGTGLGDEGLVDLIATGMELEGDGLITREQAECAAQAMVDHFGADTLLEMSTSGENPWDDASTEDQTALVNLMTECIPADVLVDIGMSEGG